MVGPMSDETTPLTEAELDALDAEITRDSQTLRTMQDELDAKVRRFRAEVRRRRETAPGTVHHFPIRPAGDLGDE
jgi:hypothetical protein